jgi:branched-chain amino acid transport system permease protein
VASIKIGNLLISVPLFIALLVSLLFAFALYAFQRFTLLGKALSATAQDRQAAELMGIRVQRMFELTWALSAATAGVAGALLIPVQSVAPNVGLRYTLIAFVIVVLGGLGSVPGAIIGGFLVAIVGGISSILLDPSLSQAVYLLMFIAVLLFRPAGLLGVRGAEVYSHE